MSEMKAFEKTTIRVGRLCEGDPNIPVALQGATVLYTTRKDVPQSEKFVMVDGDGKAIRNDEGKIVRFGYANYQVFIDRGYIELADNADEAIRADLGNLG